MSEAHATRLLIVDDESALAAALCRTLSAEGYATVAYTSPIRALETLSQQHFDVLLADLKMPEMDGVALLREALRRDPDLVGILMTGHGTLDTAVAAMQSGALDYILKPFDLTVMRPVLARAEAVSRLRRQNTALSARLSERNRTLEEAVRELTRANEDLDAFAQSVAHDLRAPVRIVGGFADILREDYASRWPAEARAHLDTISAQTQHLTDLIEALLRLARVSRQPLKKERVDMKRLVKEVIGELPGTKVPLPIEVGELPVAFGDRALLHQVVTNLLSNAVKFSSGVSEPRIRIEGDADAAECRYRVSDNGVGFDPARAQKLFGVFQRLHSEPEFEGTGVGLSLVRRIVDRHGGQIRAESARGKGATFSFTLPRAVGLSAG